MKNVYYKHGVGARVKNTLAITFSFFTVATALFVAISSFLNTTGANAVNAADWKAGRIIDDVKFTGLDMYPDNIQSFLNSKVPTCDTNGTKPASEYGRPDLTHAQYAATRGWPGPPYICLKDYYEVPKLTPGSGIPSNSFTNGGNAPPGSISAAQMIYNAARQYNISPKVLLVKLGTESSGPLTSDDWPLQRQYTYAMGAHCPDSGPGGSANCDPNYSGFSIQISEAAKLLRYYMDNMTADWWPYKKPQQNNFVLWNTTATNCGGSDVYIETFGTAALYTYTPYQPNQAALNNMYGSGDSCSAYGNRNFWRVYGDWFGSPNSWDTKTPHPDGTLINQDGNVYLLENGLKRHIFGGSIFGSYDFNWNKVKQATLGDRLLGVGKDLSTLNPNKLYRAAGTGVYALSTAPDGSQEKQLVTFNAFTGLGYSWSAVVVVSASELPAATSTANYDLLKHRNGDLVSMNSNVYLIDNDQLHYVSAGVFQSYGWQWSSVMRSTDQDKNYPIGINQFFQKGSILFDGSSLYLADISADGYGQKRPIGPWECYSLSMQYNLTTDPIRLPTSALPTRTGATLSCV